MEAFLSWYYFKCSCVKAREPSFALPLLTSILLQLCSKLPSACLLLRRSISFLMSGPLLIRVRLLIRIIHRTRTTKNILRESSFFVCWCAGEAHWHLAREALLFWKPAIALGFVTAFGSIYPCPFAILADVDARWSGSLSGSCVLEALLARPISIIFLVACSCRSQDTSVALQTSIVPSAVAKRT